MYGAKVLVMMFVAAAERGVAAWNVEIISGAAFRFRDFRVRIGRRVYSVKTDRNACRDYRCYGREERP